MAVERFSGHRRQEGALCSVSNDRLDYDCLTGGADVCVSSLMSAPQPSHFTLPPLCATRLKVGALLCGRRPSHCHQASYRVTLQLMKLQMRKAKALVYSDLCSIGSLQYGLHGREEVAFLDHTLGLKCHLR